MIRPRRRARCWVTRFRDQRHHVRRREGELRRDRERVGRSRPDLQRAQLRRLPRQRRRRRRGPEHRAALRHADQRRVRSAGRTGGSLRQLFGIGGFNVGGLNCNSGTDANPAPGATIFAGRLTTPLFGLGLVDSLPDSRFDTLASREPAAIRGIVNRVSIALPNPVDSVAARRRHARGPLRLEGRRAQPRSVLGRRLPERDGHHHLVAASAASPTARSPPRTAPTAPPPTPSSTAAPTTRCRAPTTTSRPRTNNCAGGVNELQDDVANFTFFMAHLAPPPPVAIAAGSAQDRGRTLFNSAALQCSGCHRSTPTSSCRRRRAASGGIVFRRSPTSWSTTWGRWVTASATPATRVAVTRRMRTAPLWGLRSRNMMLHDGRTTDSRRRILAHDGQGRVGQGTRCGATAFGALSTSAAK